MWYTTTREIPESETGCTRDGLKGVSKVPFQPREKGQGLVEYALVLVLIAIVVIAIYLLLEPAIGDIISEVKSNF